MEREIFAVSPIFIRTLDRVKAQQKVLFLVFYFHMLSMKQSFLSTFRIL